MNPTDKVDDLLAKAGAEWRARQPSAPEPDQDRLVQPKGTRRWVPLLAAAAVGAIATGILVLPDGKEPAVAPPVSPATAAGTPTTASGPQSTKAEDLLVRNGDKVQADGTVIAAPGQDPVLCADLMNDLRGYPPGQEPAPSCPATFAVKLTGLDLDKLGMKTTKGVRHGTAHLVGIWSDRSIAVQEQGPMVTPTPTPDGEEPVPCAPPAGGWQAKPTNLESQTMSTWLDAHASQVDGPAMLYPKGRNRGAPVVIRIGVAHGDIDQFRKDIAKVFQGNLCVVPARFSRTDVDRLQALIAPAFDQKLGLSSSSGPGLSDDGFTVQLLVFDEKVRAALAPAGLDNLTLSPKVLPVR